MKSRSLFTFIALVIVLSMVLASCSTPTPQAAAPTETTAPASGSEGQGSQTNTLKVWITWGDNPEQLQTLFNRFTDATGIKVEVNAPVADDKVIAGLSGSEPPDLLVLGGPDNVGTWQRQGMLTPLDDAIASSKIDLTDFFEAPLSQCKYLGKYYCLPWGTDIYALFWNKDLFEAAGLDPEKPPSTLEELVEMNDKLTKTDANGELTQVGFVPDLAWGHGELYSNMFGGFWYNEDGTKLTFTSQPMIDQLKWQQQFYTKYGFEKVSKVTAGDYGTADQAFYAGKVAMYVDGEWQPGDNFIKKYKPELNYGVAPFPPPAAHPERKNTAVVQGTVVVIPSGAKDKAASAKLLAWMMSPEIIADEMSVNFNLPTSKKAAQDPRFQANKKFVVFMNLMADPNAKHMVVTPINTEVNDALGQIEEKVLHEGADPEPLLKEAQDKLQPTLDKALSGK